MRLLRKLLAIPVLASLPTLLAQAQEATAFYMANEGVMVTDGDTKILFDPIYRNSYGQYLLLPEDMERALFAGEAPFDGVDAVFISHFHGDHFSAEDILALMEAQPGIQLFAPNQAVLGMREVAANSDPAIFERVNAVSLQYRDTPVSLETENLRVDAVRIPHSGWPTGRLDVENIVWRVTLGDSTTVVHMGDADSNDEHFARDASYWRRNTPDMAFPPYWFFSNREGQQILDSRLGARRSIGIHVPMQIPADPLQRPDYLRSADIFTQPGETRRIR